MTITRRRALRLGLSAGPGLWLADWGCAQDAARRSERRDLEPVFSEAGTVGAMAIFEPASGGLTVVNAARAEQRLIPASTFKLASSLIALEVGAVKDEEEIIPYDGRPQPSKAWEQDMPMREAFSRSAVPVYQELARRIGLERFQAWLARLDYGNRQTGTTVDRFWLDGPLQVSAVEQAIFAARLARKELPLSERSQAIVRTMARLEPLGTKVLFGKTGWSGSSSRIGWLTGWIEGDGHLAAFSLNMDMPSVAESPKRLALVKTVLARLGKS